MSNKKEKKVLPKELTLDYKKWICGSSRGINGTYTGYGTTELLNNEGFQCCLGQFALQSGVKKKDIKGLLDPETIEEEISGLTNNGDNSSFSLKAININDDFTTTIAKKVKGLKKLCGHFKRKLFLKNFPKHILKEIGPKAVNGVK